MSHPRTYRVNQIRLILAAALILALLAVVGIILSANALENGSTRLDTAAVTALEEADPRLADDSATTEFSPAEDSGCPPARGVPAFPGVYLGILTAIATGALAYLIRRRLLANE